MALINCRECNSQISSKAETCPSCGVRRRYEKKRTTITAYFFGSIFIVFVIYAVIGSISEQTHNSRTVSAVVDDLTLLISKYGPPDTDESTAYDNPRPPIVTRIITYKKQNLSAAYVVDALVGEPPPYKKWKLIGFQYAKSKAVMKPQEAFNRLEKRKALVTQ